MTFETWNDLNEHDGTHKSFECVVCVYTSESEEEIKMHMLSHRGEKPYEIEHICLMLAMTVYLGQG